MCGILFDKEKLPLSDSITPEKGSYFLRVRENGIVINKDL